MYSTGWKEKEEKENRKIRNKEDDEDIGYRETQGNLVGRRRGRIFKKGTMNRCIVKKKPEKREREDKKRFLVGTDEGGRLEKYVR